MNSPRRRNRYNNPSVIYVIADVLLSMLVFYLLVEIFSNDDSLQTYFLPFLFFLLWWIFLGVAFKKYILFAKRELNAVVKSCFQANTIASATTLVGLLLFPSLHYSIYFLLAVTIVISIGELAIASICFSFINAEVQDGEADRNRPTHKDETSNREIYPVDDDVREFLSNYIIGHGGIKLLSFLQDNAELFITSTLMINTIERFNIEKISRTKYTTIVNLHIVNDIREINSFFVTVNERMPYGGTFIGCYESLHQRKSRIIGDKHRFYHRFIYAKDFLIGRVLPKLNLTREFYFWITGGKDRVLSKAEVLGRLYFTGFEIVQETNIHGLSYFVARKIKNPVHQEEPTYSVILVLPRIGKRAVLFKVYKLRTMYPYSAYLQDYVYQHNKLTEGGKFHHDFRITTLGHLMRRYWLDELPMLVNLLKGEMKLVGIRPLSRQYFSLYSPQLQEQRVRHRPGLLPPFYADMPKTLEEIQASEKKYLDQCEQKGTFMTDIRYLFVILFNIMFKKVRSK